MGITGLLPFLRGFQKQVKLSDFTGRTVAIDASCWIHKALAVSISQSGNRQRLADIFRKYLLIVKRAAMTIYIVFDGLLLPAKASEVEQRQSDREERLRKADNASLSSKEANKFRSQAASITFDDISTCIDICLEENVRYVMSPYEADAQITFLLNNGYADMVITEDSDLLAYGCKEVIMKLCLSGEGQHLLLDDILDGLKLNFQQFQNMCIVAGCDYLHNVRGIGIRGAYKIISSGDDMFSTLENKGAPNNYKDHFHETKAVFSHQTVFDVNTLKTVPLHMWESNTSTKTKHLCGKLLDDQFSNDLAAGNIDPKSCIKMKSNPLLKRVTCNSTPNDSVEDMSPKTNGQEEIKIHIINVEEQPFSYNIPSFPVMSVDLLKVQYTWNGVTHLGVINAKEHSALKVGNYTCTSHCKINIGGVDYLVLWELHCDMATSCSAPIDPPGFNSVFNDEGETNVREVQETHCLPFKVLGTCYSTSRQKALEMAFDCMNEYNRPVFVKLKAEPTNQHDKNAIAVHIMTIDDWDKVGYIASELTKYLHEPLKANALDVTVNEVRFRTTFMLVGYYLTIDITKMGLWDDTVIKASSKVK